MTAPYFSHTNPDNATAAAAAQLRRAELAFWAAHLPELDADFELVAQKMYNATGVNEGRVKEIFLALYRLEEMPTLRAFQEEHHVLDLDRLIAINKSLDKLGTPLSGALERIDEALTAYLRPRRPNQSPPTRAHIRRKLNDLINLEDNTIALKDPRRRPHYAINQLGSMTSELSLTASAEVIAAADKHVREVAKREEISVEEAAFKLLTGQLKPQPTVVLNTYRASDVPNAPTFIQGYGWVSSSCLPTAGSRELDPDQVTESYVTPPTMAAFIEGMDGTCRYSGCNEPAERCQKDHRINHADGGPTTPANLASLCQSHHSIKTDGRAFYIMDPLTRDVYWLFEDGTWTVTEPTGPLAPKNKRWVQTFGQCIDARRERAHQEAQKLREELQEELQEELKEEQP
ncbi:HNH endonuclease signature motif containing protein [Corynebacterium sp.]|uniref:HNH endonuclease signature motif containing protein n=1 Tax=Corynebacterium sp. TaxID=1720 RepID=UPI0026DA7032|nr:HNH endonuclease signature motif containing protein [Corynebacterium sp.]MDO5032610.1 HNH endonuclease signature motif containing protein [Corynebacterium sp.]